MAAPTRKRRFPWMAATVALLAAPLLVIPSWIRGAAALEWVDYYASLDGLPRPRRAAARSLAQKTELAIRNLAPLPQASRAALQALEIGEQVQQAEGDRESALIIYRSVQAACAEVGGRFWSGPGFAVIEARALALSAAAERREAE